MNNTVLSTRNIDLLVADIANEVVKKINSQQTKEDLSKKRYSIKEVAELYGVIPLTVRNQIKKGNLKAEKFGHKYYVQHSELFDSNGEVKSIKYKR
ncbi:helix-turn-helix domain-containing protein [Flavobacteriaceae bacterium F08102]|nr:helix-turn-helix domain-containing protein [Flavobacteriaceae bacterium F08102]